MKSINKYKHLLLYSLLLSLFVCLVFFNSGIVTGADMSFHLSRFSGIISAIQDHQFPIAIYPYKNFGFGYGSPLFYCDFFLIIPAIIWYIFKFPIITTYKFLVFIFVFFTAYTSSFVTYHIFKSKKSALVAPIILLGSEYYLVDLYIRSAVGEIIAISFFPLLFYFVYEWIIEKKDNYISLGLSFACIILSHNISFLLAVVTFGLFIILNIKTLLIDRQRIVVLIKATIIGFLLSLFFIMPLLEQYFSMYLRVHQSVINTFGGKSLNIVELFSDFIFQTFLKEDFIDIVGKTKSLGLVAIVPVIIYFFVKNKNKYINQLLVIYILYLIMSTVYFPIEKIPFLNFLQFSTRLYIVVPVIASFIVAYSINKIKYSKGILLVIALYFIINTSVLFININNAKDKVFFPENATMKEIFEEEKYFKYKSIDADWNWYELGNAEYLPDHYFLYPKEDKCIDDKYSNQISCTLQRNGTHVQFDLNLNNDTEIQLPLTWYKGYVAYEVGNDGNIINYISTFPNQFKGKVALNAFKGEHAYVVEYRSTKMQKLSATISILSAFVVLILERKKH